MQSLLKSGIDSLYKFKTFDSDNHYQDLLNNILYFPSPSQLNDPFDSKIPIRYDLCTNQELFIINKKFNSSSSLKQTRAKRREHNRAQIKKFREELKNNPSLVMQRMESFTESRIGIYSFTEKLENLLLWSHYAESHKGFCIEFSAQSLRQLLIDVYLTQKGKAFIFKVEYKNEYPIIHPVKNTYEERLKLQFLTKSKDWEYEQEWRIIYMDPFRKITIPANVIKNIFFGLLASTDNIKKSIEILKKSNPSIGFFKASKKENAFGLKFEKMADS